ncbi:unnamed protein product [Brugia timori]|uniref:Uncharacterized protein n=1 Tax=Brugia timori TaxID=42155 RepID=A0A0R3QIS4_9BILA|nr:unnamed protein product [Brugia timori]
MRYHNLVLILKLLFKILKLKHFLIFCLFFFLYSLIISNYFFFFFNNIKIKLK